MIILIIFYKNIGKIIQIKSHITTRKNIVNWPKSHVKEQIIDFFSALIIYYYLFDDICALGNSHTYVSEEL